MFSQNPSNDLWWSRLGFLDGQLLYTTASIVIGPLHSFLESQKIREQKWISEKEKKNIVIEWIYLMFIDISVSPK